LMDIKRVAFETRPVTSTNQTTVQQSITHSAPSPQIDRAAITAMVDKFLAARKPPVIVETSDASDSKESLQAEAAPAPSKPQGAMNNGYRPVDFVCEDDVRRALERGEKIYISARTIITPSARDLGDAREVFAKA
jgi:hypothetical protein